MHNITSIPNIQVDFIDPITSKIARPWYLFLENLWTLQGSGTSDTTIMDLQKTPPQVTVETIAQLSPNLDEFRITPPILLNVPVSSYLVTPFTNVASILVTHNFDKYPVVNVIDNTGETVVPLTIIYDSLNAFTVTFSANTTGNVLAVTGT